MISEFGGEPIKSKDNTINPSSLHFALGTLQGDLFGQPIYPSLSEKAASLAWHIITGHVFVDGNKRTGMESARLFLEINGIDFPIDDEVISVSEEIATGNLSLEDFIDWMNQKIGSEEIDE